LDGFVHFFDEAVDCQIENEFTEGEGKFYTLWVTTL
jgi:hypothetical protein